MKKIAKMFLTSLMVMLLILQSTAVFALEVLEGQEPIEETTVTTEFSNEQENNTEAVVTEENTGLAEVETEAKEEMPVEEVKEDKTETTAVSNTDLEVDKDVETDVVGAEEYRDGNVVYRYNSWDNDATAIAYGTYITSATIKSAVPLNGKQVTVTKVGSFRDCTALKTVTLPATIKSIDGSAFRNCTSLTSINIPNGVTEFGSYAFANSGITAMSMPNSVTKVSWNAFMDCSKLTSVTLSNKIKEIDSSTFEGCTSLKTIIIPSSVTTISSSAFKNSGLQTITIPESVTSMSSGWSSGTFQNCTSLTTVKILGKINSLGDCMFKGCTSLTNVTLPNTITYSGDSDFSGCTSLRTITLPDSLKNIGTKMFENCYNLTNIKLPDNAEEVNVGAFMNCSSLRSISFPYNVKNIYGGWGNGTFQGCTSLNSIYFTKSIQNVSDDAFYGFNDYCTIYGYPESAAKSIAQKNGFGYVDLTPVTSIKVTGNKTVPIGKTTTLTATVLPSNAYQKNVVWSSSNNAIATVDSNGKVTGRKTGAVTITAMSKDGGAIKGTFNITVSLTDLPFNDVAGNAWYYEAVKYCYTNNIISGTTTTTFSPATQLTRGMVVTILHRMEGSPKVSGTTKFKDVQNSKQYYFAAVKWASDKNIVSGYKNNNFGPNDNITREDLAVILYKYAKYKGKNVSKTNNLSAFSDRSKVSNYATTQVKWAVGAGVITGNKNGTLNPRGTATRAEAAAMLQKYCQKVGR